MSSFIEDIKLIDLIREKLPDDGSPIGNHAVIRALETDGFSISREKYYELRAYLIEQGEAERVYGGHGGRVRRTKPIEPIPIPPDPRDKDWLKEKNLYPWFADFLRYHWRQPLQSKPIIDIIANIRIPQIDRVWSNPDIILLDLISYKWLPNREVEVYSFELKTSKSGNRSDVFQALAHGAFAHFPYLGWHTKDIDLFKIDDVEQTCRDYNVGLITFSDPTSFKSYEVRNIPSRHIPSLSAIDDMLDKLCIDDQKRLSEWLQGDK